MTTKVGSEEFRNKLEEAKDGTIGPQKKNNKCNKVKHIQIVKTHEFIIIIKTIKRMHRSSLNDVVGGPTYSEH